MARAVTTVVRGLSPGDKMFVKLKYSSLSNYLDTVTSDFNYIQFKLNSPIDPGASLSGNNAFDLSQYASQYYFGLCHGSKVKIMLVNMDNDIPFRMGLCPNPNSTTGSSPPTISATDDASMMTNPYMRSTIVGNATGNDTAILRNYIAVKKLAGLRRLEPENPAYIFTGNTVDPNQTFWWLLWVQAVANATDNINALVSLEVTYYITFYNRKLNQ